MFAPVVLTLRPSSSKGSHTIVTKQKLRRSRDLEKLLAHGPRNASLNVDDPVPTCQTGCPGRWGRVGGGRPRPRKQNRLPRSRKASGGASCSARRASVLRRRARMPMRLRHEDGRYGPAIWSREKLGAAGRSRVRRSPAASSVGPGGDQARF